KTKRPSAPPLSLSQQQHHHHHRRHHNQLRLLISKIKTIKMNNFEYKLKLLKSSVKGLEMLYGSMMKYNATQDCLLLNQFIIACGNAKKMDLAVFAYTQLDNPNIYIYNAVIGAFIRCFQPVQSIRFYMKMLRDQVRPTSFTFPPIVKGCGYLGALVLGEAVHGHIWRHGFVSNMFVQTALVDFYSSLGKIAMSREVFDSMPIRDMFAWTTLVSAYIQSGDLGTALKFFDQMTEKNAASWNTMIHGYAKIGDVESAKCLFQRMPEKDLISWTTMINCYSQNQRYSEALEIFTEMKDKGIKPDVVTMTTIISACAHLGVADQGKEMHLYLMQEGFEIDVYIGSALVDMYAKCGILNRSLVVFYKLQEKNLFCWNSVIESLAAHGYAKEALEMFRRMQKEEISPNSVTFVSVLSACTHAGFVDQGRTIFQNMSREFSISPAIEHYGCMVDLLCKAGLLQEALELITSMPMRSNSIIWGALLGGCKLHKNLHIAQVAVDNLMLLEPKKSGHHMLLVNMYAEANRWSDVSKLRAKMKKVGAEKTCPGSSWIEH
ncbi:hypothetical protein Leryth_006214, partial [Lithospermum erythrorhizon]